MALCRDTIKVPVHDRPGAPDDTHVCLLVEGHYDDPVFPTAHRDGSRGWEHTPTGACSWVDSTPVSA